MYAERRRNRRRETARIFPARDRKYIGSYRYPSFDFIPDFFTKNRSETMQRDKDEAFP